METKGDQDRKTVTTSATEERNTMSKADELEAGKQNRQSARSRAMARAF